MKTYNIQQPNKHWNFKPDSTPDTPNPTKLFPGHWPHDETSYFASSWQNRFIQWKEEGGGEWWSEGFRGKLAQTVSEGWEEEDGWKLYI